MLYEVYYPKDKFHNKPAKGFYGFVEEESIVNLAVFDAKYSAAYSVLGLKPETQAELAYTLLKKHMYGVQVDSIKVVFFQRLSTGKLVGERWSIEINKHYVDEVVNSTLARRDADLGFLGRFFNRKSSLPLSGRVTINKDALVIGLTEKISLYDREHLDSEKVKELFQTLKCTDYGDFNEILSD